MAVFGPRVDRGRGFCGWVDGESYGQSVKFLWLSRSVGLFESSSGAKAETVKGGVAVVQRNGRNSSRCCGTAVAEWNGVCGGGCAAECSGAIDRLIYMRVFVEQCSNRRVHRVGAARVNNSSPQLRRSSVAWVMILWDVRTGSAPVIKAC
ncbi:hypothetical protein F0562_034545 [Nyssa sinensis]|uniref:Uncharacterized protein n=1 Tax=Nyssa sinensis TaxID=561372 RepID=A0A5J5AIG0_9ASTE|nr:hypothetical protein F0562_034545 [Nyssa sinensis]